jgi:dihydroorotase
MPLMLDAVNKKRLSLGKLVELTSRNPARIFRIKGKGRIKEGYDADLTIVDMDLTKRVDARKMFTKCGWSAFNNKLLKGWPVMTIVNGNIVFEKGKVHTHMKGEHINLI